MADLLNSAIELHDSILASVGAAGTAIQVALEPAYVHSVRRPGIDAGSGFVQNFVLEIEHGQIEGEAGTLPTNVLDGAVEIGSERSESVVTLPIDSSGPVRLTLYLAPDNRRIAITGKRLSARAVSDAEYVEEFRPE